MIALNIKNVSKKFREKQVLKNVSLEVQRGDSVVILGESGSGKSVLLKIILGIIAPDSGYVKINEKEIIASDPFLGGRVKCKTKIGFMFQGCALFDSLNIYENVRMYLDYHNIGKEDYRHKTAIDCLKKVGLSDNLNIKVSDLSGGMAKRVAIARILAYRPDIIIFDEPTSGLDNSMSLSITNMIRKLWKNEGFTCITVTHDSVCANILGDRILMKSKESLKEIAKNEENICLESFEKNKSLHLAFT